jgi:hypothetical protein
VASIPASGIGAVRTNPSFSGTTTFTNAKSVSRQSVPRPPIEMS